MRVCVECHHSNPDTHTQCQACGGALILPEGTILQGRLRRYRVVRVLGVGGFGVTYLIAEVPTGRSVVVKELQARHIHDPKVKELFEREAQALAKLDPAQGVPDIFDFFYSQDRRAYLVMEYVEGETLADLMVQQGALCEGKVVDVGLKVLQVLVYLHQQGVIHRDVKPGNVILRPDGSVVLIDLGAVKQAVSAQVTTGGHVTSTMAATPGYAPPEQARGLSVDRTADLFGLGATLIRLLAGIHPNDLINPKTGDFEWRDRVQVKEELARVIKKATAYRPVDRYQSADEMSRALEAVAERIPARPEEANPSVVREPNPPLPPTSLPPVPSPLSTPTLSPARPRVPVWVWVLGGVAVLALVMGIVMALRGDGRGQPAVVTKIVKVTTTPMQGGIAARVTNTPRPTSTLWPTAIPTHTPTPTTAAMPTPELAVMPTVAAPSEGLNGVYYYGFNTTLRPFENVLVRQAFALALDRAALSRLASDLNPDSDCAPATTFTPPDILGLDLYREVGLPYDPERARSLLSQAGYPDGSGLRVLLCGTTKVIVINP